VWIIAKLSLPECVFRLLPTINVLWLQPSRTVLTSSVSTVAHATTGWMMTSYVSVPGTSQEPIARQVSLKALIHDQTMSYDNAACLMFSSYVGWPSTATRPESGGRKCDFGWRSLCHCFTEVAVSMRNAVFISHRIRIVHFASPSDTRQYLMVTKTCAYCHRTHPMCLKVYQGLY